MQLCIGTIQAPLALATWERTESRLIGSVCWRWIKLSKKADRTTALASTEVAQISVLFRDVYAEPKDVLFGFMPKVRLRTCRRTSSNDFDFARAIEETSIPAIELREANSREARVVGCL